MEIIKIKNSVKQTVPGELPIRNIRVKTDLRSIKHVESDFSSQQDKSRKRWELNGLCG